MSPVLYHMEASPPCRAVRLTAKALNVDLQLKTCDLQKGEQKTPEFTKVRP